MALNLQGIEQDISVVLGSGNTGALAAGAATTGFVNNLQNTLAEKGAQIGGLLGSLGLSGFLAGAAQGANKSTTAQSQSLLSAVAPNLGKYLSWAGLALIVGAFVFKLKKSVLFVGAAIAGVFTVYKLYNPSPSVLTPQSTTAAGGATPPAPTSLFGNITNVASGIFSGVSSIFHTNSVYAASPGDSQGNANPLPLADSNGSPTPGTLVLANPSGATDWFGNPIGTPYTLGQDSTSAPSDSSIIKPGAAAPPPLLAAQDPNAQDQATPDLSDFNFAGLGNAGAISG